VLITHEREKLINSIIFFANHTRHLGKIKLWKLLYLLDFEHYRDTGRSVTGLEYCAWKKGPVPVALHNEIEAPQADLSEKVHLNLYPCEVGTALVVTPKVDFDSSLFSKRELRLMHKLAEDFKFTQANDMIERTHLENEPWHKVYVVQERKQQVIPYELASRAQEQEAVQSLHVERSEIIHNFASV